MSRKIGKILRDVFYTRQKGLATIPLMIALLLMAIAIPVVTMLVQQQQDIRNRAAYEIGGGGAGVDPCEICNASCSEGRTCFVGAENCCTHTFVGVVTPTPTCEQQCAGIPEPDHTRCMAACSTYHPSPTLIPTVMIPTISIGPGCVLCNGVECCSPNSCIDMNGEGTTFVCGDDVTGQCGCSAETCKGQTCNNGRCFGDKDCSKPQACGVNSAGFCSSAANCNPETHHDLEPIGGNCPDGGVCCKHNAPNDCTNSCVESAYCRSDHSVLGKCNGGLNVVCCDAVGECATGSKVCNSGSPARVGVCNDSVWSWTNCSSDTCNGNECGTPSANYCSEHGATECSGGKIRTCRDNIWSDWYPCTTGACNGNVCSPCAPGTTRCNVDTIENCNGAGWVVTTTCPDGCIEEGQPPHCRVAECTPGETKCNGSKLLTCGVATSQWNETDCGADGCYVTGGVAHCGKYEVCTPGDTICIDGKLSTCNSAGTQYEGETPCLYGCDKDGKKCNPAPTPTIGGGGTTTTPTGPVACDCRSNRSAKIDRADANCDGKTDILDISIWRSESKDLGGTETNKATWLADFNCDGFVKDDDRDKWLEIYTNSLPFAK